MSLSRRWSRAGKILKSRAKITLAEETTKVYARQEEIPLEFSKMTVNISDLRRCKLGKWRERGGLERTRKISK